jgi:hypothetical protein
MQSSPDIEKKIYALRAQPKNIGKIQWNLERQRITVSLKHGGRNMLKNKKRSYMSYEVYTSDITTRRLISRCPKKAMENVIDQAPVAIISSVDSEGFPNTKRCFPKKKGWLRNFTLNQYGFD